MGGMSLLDTALISAELHPAHCFFEFMINLSLTSASGFILYICSTLVPISFYFLALFLAMSLGSRPSLALCS